MKSPHQIDLKKTLIAVIIGIMIIGIVPFAGAWALTPPEKEFNGALVNIDDLSVYLSAIRQGTEGNWLFNFSFSPEAIQPRLTYLPYLAIGHLINIVGGSAHFWFHVFRVLGGIFAILSLTFLLRSIFPKNGRIQLTGLLLLTFGSGLGWVFVSLISPSSLLLADINVPEWNLVTSVLDSPHFVFGIGLEAVLFGILIRLEKTEEKRKFIVIGSFIALITGLVYAFHIPTIGMVLGFYMLSIAIQARNIPWKTWFSGLLVLAPLIPLLYYYGISSRQDALWDLTHVLNNVITPPPPPGILIGYGLIGMMALFGIKAWFRQKRSPLIPIWAGVNLLIIYFPISFSGRFILGLFIPITILGAFSLEEVILPRLKTTNFFTKFSTLTPTPYKTLRRVFILLTLPSTLLVTLGLIQNAALSDDYPFYYPSEEIQAMRWMEENTDAHDLILASYPIGSYLPRYMSGKVFLGHLNLTIDLENKLADLEKFWDENTPQEWKENFIEEWGFTYIYQGKYENELGGLSVVPPGKVVYENESVKIYAAP